MLELNISNIQIQALYEFQKESFDKDLIRLRPVFKDVNVRMAFDSALHDVVLCITDTSTQVAINIFSSWLMLQYEKGNVDHLFRLNGRNLLKEELRNKEMINKILEEELKTIRLKKMINDEQK